MQKSYIKLNENDEHLSIGNLFRIIKELSKNKTSAMQSELFCIIFELEGINDTTVNNYCVGCRNIGSAYKQIMLNREKKYKKNYNEFVETILSLLSVIDGVIYTTEEIEFINYNDTARDLALKLYNLSKNDKQVSIEFSNKLNEYIQDDNIYECLIEEIIFTVLYKKQPINEEGLKKEMFESVLMDTSISSDDLQEYLSLKLNEGINFDASMKKIAEKGNAYANFELGLDEYNGYVDGKPRFIKAYDYFLKASKLNHAGANYMLGFMLINGIVGHESKKDLETGYNYLLKSKDSGNVASINTIGNMYKNGIYPLEKDLDKAMDCFKEAASKHYVFAYNNIAEIEKINGNEDKMFDNYRIAADLGESWSCNKIGEYYRNKDDYVNAFNYYNRALEANIKTRYFYAYYNLAKYYYLDGCNQVGIEKDINKAKEYFIKASNNNVFEASLELLYLYVKEYLYTREVYLLKKIDEVKIKIETHKKYNNDIKDIIEKELKKIKDDLIDIDIK